MSELEEEKEGSRRLSPEEWQELTNAFELGQMRAAELARKYGVTPQAISQRFNRRGITFGSRKAELEKKADEKVAAAIAERVVPVVESFSTKRLKRIEETKEQAYNAAQAISAMNMKIMQDCLKPGGPALGMRQHDLKTLRGMAAVLKDTLQVRWQVLGMDEGDDENEKLPELPIVDLTQQEIDELSAGDGLEIDDMELEAEVPDLSTEVIEEE